VIAVDGPGTGEAPIRVLETAERMFSRAIDYLQTRSGALDTQVPISGA
jgi:esterase FrsA